MARHGSASPRIHESHTGNGNLINQLQEQSSTTQQGRMTRPGLTSSGNALAADMATAAREYDLQGVPRKSHDIDANLKRRARRLAVDGRVDHDTRRLIRYALENRDPYLVQLVTRVERGEMKVEHLILDTD